MVCNVINLVRKDDENKQPVNITISTMSFWCQLNDVVASRSFMWVQSNQILCVRTT